MKQKAEPPAGFSREIESVTCSCGGEVVDQETTKAEEEGGCGHPGCCVRAWRCRKCGTRFTIRLCAPEYRYD